MTVHVPTMLLAGLLAFCVVGCGVIHPDHGDGAADIPATQGGFAGAAEGSPGNAMNVGSNSSVVISGVSGRR